MPAATRRPSGRRPPLWLVSARERPAAFLTLLILAGLSVAVSVLTPMLLRSAQEVVLAQRISSAGLLDRSVVGEAVTQPEDPVGPAAGAADDITGVLRTPGLWSGTTRLVRTTNTVPWQVQTGHATDRLGYLSIAPVRCAGLVITVGTCAVTRSDVLLPASLQRRLRVPVGTTVVLDPTVFRPPTAQVVGTYDDARGLGALLADPARAAGNGLKTEPAPMLGAGGAESLPYSLTLDSIRQVDGSLRLSQLPALRADLAAATRATLSLESGESSARVRTGLPAVLDDFDEQSAAAGVITAAIALEALVLGWFALGQVIQRVSRSRAVEWGIGRTRGIRRTSWLAGVFVEPAVAVLAGGLLGFAAAAGVAQLVVLVALGPTAAVEPFRPLVLAAAGLAVLGSLLALVAASIRSAQLPLTALLRETTEPRRLSRAALVAQAGAALVTAAVLWSVLTQRQVSGAQLALLTPSLIAIVLGIAAVRLSVVLVRRRTARFPRSLAGLVVGRQLARAPSALASAVLVAVGVALVTYALQLVVVEGRTVDGRARVAAGAVTVLRVDAPEGRLLAAVRAADPSGRAAMAVQETSGSGLTGVQRVVAVDSSRLSATTTWLPQWRGARGADLQKLLDPATPGGPRVIGSSLRVTVRGLASGLTEPLPVRAPRLGAVVARGAVQERIDLGPLHDGVLAAEVPCAGGCRLAALVVADTDALQSEAWGARFQIAAIGTDRQPSGYLSRWLRTPQLWRQRVADLSDPSLRAQVTFTSGPGGLSVEGDDSAGGQTIALEPAVGPAVLPALIAAGTRVEPFAAFSDVVFGDSLSGQPLLLRVVGRAPVLPRAADDGVMVDLSQLQRIEGAAADLAVDEVWLSAGPHPGFLDRLRARGVRVTGSDTLARARAHAVQDVAARAVGLVPVTAACAFALTMLALLGTRTAAAGSKRRDWETLRVTGIRVRTLRRLAAVDAALPAAAGAVLGVLAGATAWAITATRLPLLAGSSGDPPLDAALAVGPILVLLGAAVIVTGAVGMVAARVELAGTGGEDASA